MCEHEPAALACSLADSSVGSCKMGAVGLGRVGEVGMREVEQQGS